MMEINLFLNEGIAHPPPKNKNRKAIEVINTKWLVNDTNLAGCLEGSDLELGVSKIPW